MDDVAIIIVYHQYVCVPRCSFGGEAPGLVSKNMTACCNTYSVDVMGPDAWSYD